MLGLIASLPLLLAQAPAPGGPAPAPAPTPAQATAPAAAPTVPAAPATATAAPAAPATPVGGAPAPAAAQPQQSPFSTLIPLLPIPILFYFLMIRPQQQQEKKRKAMINQMERNSRVITSAGIYGTVVSVDKDGDTVLLRLGSDPGVKVEFSRASIIRVVDGGDKPKKEGKDGDLS
jgi:preprotein translocase subunit YajC